MNTRSKPTLNNPAIRRSNNRIIIDAIPGNVICQAERVDDFADFSFGKIEL